MVTSRNLAKAISNCDSIKNFVNCKGNICFKPSPSYFLEGVLVERTAYKGVFYIWSFVSPLWHQRNTPLSNYGIRLPWHHENGDDEQDTATKIDEIVRNESIERDRLLGPEISFSVFRKEFFENFSSSTSRRVVSLIDYAVCCAMTGNSRLACNVMEKVQAISNPGNVFQREFLEKLNQAASRNDTLSFERFIKHSSALGRRYLGIGC